MAAVNAAGKSSNFAALEQQNNGPAQNNGKAQAFASAMRAASFPLCSPVSLPALRTAPSGAGFMGAAVAKAKTAAGQSARATDQTGGADAEGEWGLVEDIVGSRYGFAEPPQDPSAVDQEVDSGFRNNGDNSPVGTQVTGTVKQLAQGKTSARSKVDINAQLRLMFGTSNNGVYTTDQVMKAAAALQEAGAPVVDEAVTGSEQGRTVSPPTGASSTSTPALAFTPVPAQDTASALPYSMAETLETVLVSSDGQNTSPGGVAPGHSQQQITASQGEPVVASSSTGGTPPVPPGQPPAPAGEPPEPDPQSIGTVKTLLARAWTPVANAGKWIARQDWRLGVQARLRSGVASQVAQTTRLAPLLGRVPGVDIKIGQPTWRSWGVAIGTKGNWHLLPQAIRQVFRTPKGAVRTLGKWANETLTTSVRPREDLNTTMGQLGLSFMSKQTAFQFKGSNLLRAGEQILFSDGGGSALYVIPRSAKTVGDAQLGNGKVVEVTYSLGVKADTNVTLPAGDVAFFGEGADNKEGVARLLGDLTYTKLFKEVKAYPTAGIGPFSRLLPVRIRTETRPEIPGERTISDGEIVSRQFLVQNQAVLERANLKIQFTVDGRADLTAFLKDPSVAAVQEMKDAGFIKAFDEEGGFDPTLVRSWVPGHGVVGDGGLRLSAVSQKPTFKTMTDLTGRTTLQWDEEQTNLDVIFQDPLTLSGSAAWLNPVLTPDRWVSRTGYSATQWINQKVTGVNGKLPPWLQFKRGMGYINERLPSWLQFKTPPVHYVPTQGAVYEAMTGKKQQFGATSGTRYTISIQSPNVNVIPFLQVLAGSLEVRAQLKTEEQSVASAIKKNGHLVPREYTDRNTGLVGVAKVPGWLSDAIDWSQQTRSHLVVPKGAYESLNEFLDQIDDGSSRQTAISDFRNTLLPLFREPAEDNPNPAYTGFLSPKNLSDIDRFLSRFARPETQWDFSALPPYRQGYGPGPHSGQP
jgi:hypothetical protein